MDNHIIITFWGFSSSHYCVFCVDNGSDLQAKLLAKTGQRTVPNVFINGKHIGGCDDTSKLFSSGQIKTML